MDCKKEANLGKMSFIILLVFLVSCIESSSGNVVIEPKKEVRICVISDQIGCDFLSFNQGIYTFKITNKIDKELKDFKITTELCEGNKLDIAAYGEKEYNIENCQNKKENEIYVSYSTDQDFYTKKGSLIFG